MTQQPERDALEAAARAIHDRYEAMTHWVKTLKNEPRQFEESSIRDVHRQDAQVAINAYLAALSAQGMRVIQESELKSAEGALFNAEQHFKMFADEITGDYPARAADDASRPHRLGLCAKLAGEAWRDLYALIYGEQYQEPVYCGPDPAENTDRVRIGKNDPSAEHDRVEPSNPSDFAAGGEGERLPADPEQVPQ